MKKDSIHCKDYGEDLLLIAMEFGEDLLKKEQKQYLPSKATAKISMRLVPNQDSKKVGKEFTKYVKSLVPKSIKIKVTEMHGGSPVVIPLDHPAILAASKATSKAFGKKTVYTREGGSIPIVVDFVKQLNAPAILMGLRT